MSGKREDGTQETGLLKKAFGRWLGLFLVLVAALVFYLVAVNLDIIFDGIFYVLGILKPVIYGCVIAYILNPLMKIFQRWVTAIYIRKGKELTEKRKALSTGWLLCLHLLQAYL